MIADDSLFFGADFVRDIFEDEDSIPDHHDAITEFYHDEHEDIVTLEDIFNHMFGDDEDNLDDVICVGDFEE